MKRSQIALLVMGGALAGVVIAFVVSARIALSSDGFAFFDGPHITGNVELHGFRNIDVAGHWNVNLSRGDDWQIELSYPDGFEDRVKAGLAGERLWLRVDSRSWWEEPELPATADIVMPELEELGLKGASRVEMEVAGVTRLKGRESRYDELELSVAGASHIDLRGVTVRDADLDLAGASKVTLTMNGGKLSGSMAGGGSVEYYGPVSEEDIRLAGVSWVESMQ